MGIEDDQNVFRLMMPFVVCESNDGPYDDKAYCAGWEMGKLDILLSVAVKHRIRMTVRRLNLPQADLIAMSHNWIMKEEAMHPSVEDDVTEEWACVTLNRVMEGL